MKGAREEALISATLGWRVRTIHTSKAVEDGACKLQPLKQKSGAPFSRVPKPGFQKDLPLLNHLGYIYPFPAEPWLIEVLCLPNRGRDEGDRLLTGLWPKRDLCRLPPRSRLYRCGWCTGSHTPSHIFHSLRHFQNCYLKPAAGFQQRSLRL